MNMDDLTVYSSFEHSAKPANLDDVLQYQDWRFVEAAYELLLARKPDKAGYGFYLSRIRGGVGKIQILKEISRSPEAVSRGQSVNGLRKALRMDALGSVPVIGSVFRRLLSLEGNTRLDVQLRILEQKNSVLSDMVAATVSQQTAADTRLSQVSQLLGDLSTQLTQVSQRLALLEELHTRDIQRLDKSVEDLQQRQSAFTRSVEDMVQWQSNFAQSANVAESIRMVVWDLDETFWRGTLSEGGIKEYVQAHHDIIVTLARRGILSSICSKNDPNAATAILQEKGLLDYLVFPSISWEPKGARLSQLIESVQLRAPTIMFIDDNPNNRAEATALIPGLQVEAETFIPHMLSDPRFAGKDDRELTRLRQYKLLESKKQDRGRVKGSNEDFLRTCDIRVFIDYDVEGNLDRAIELINRTNQLNYTKRRLPEDIDAARQELRREISYWDRRAGLVYVTDKYGDYGYIGFFLTISQRSKLVEGSHNSRIIHFCLSCRTLGMQIEKWLYDHLGRPELTVVGEVLTDLSSPSKIDWVSLVDRKVASTSAPELIAPRVVVYGGCESQVISGYLNSYTSRMEVYADYAANGLFRRTEDSTTLLDICNRDKDMFKAEAAALGLAIELEATNFFASGDQATLFVFNISADAHGSPKIRHKTKGWRLMLAPQHGPLGDANFVELPEDQLVSILLESDAYTSYTEEQREHIRKVASHIRENYELAPPLSDAEKLLNAKEIIRRVPVGSKLIFAVNADKWRPKFPSEEVCGIPVIRKYTESLRGLVAEYPYVRVVSYSEVVTTFEDMCDGWHYSREVYLKFSQLLVETAKSLPPRSD